MSVSLVQCRKEGLFICAAMQEVENKEEQSKKGKFINLLVGVGQIPKARDLLASRVCLDLHGTGVVSPPPQDSGSQGVLEGVIII